MTSIGEMSAARITMPRGREVVVREEEGSLLGDLRRALTTSFTPRLSVRWAAAGVVLVCEDVWFGGVGNVSRYLS